MKEIDFRKLLMLVIIRNSPKFRNSYDLTKVLARKFGIIEIVDLRQSLEMENFINTELREGIHHYTITEKGEEILVKNYSELHLEAINKYPGQSIFVNSIFQPSDTNN